MKKLKYLIGMFIFIALCITGCGGGSGGGNNKPIVDSVTVNESAPNSSKSYNNSNLNLSLALDFKGISANKVNISNLSIKKTFPTSSDVTSTVTPYSVYEGVFGDSVRYYIKGISKLPTNNTTSSENYKITGNYSVTGDSVKALPEIIITVSTSSIPSEQGVTKIKPTGTELDPLGDTIQVKIKLNDANKDKKLKYVWTINGVVDNKTLIVNADGITPESPSTGKERTYTQNIKINNTVNLTRSVVLKVYLDGTSTLIGETSYTQKSVTPAPPPSGG